MEILDGMVRSEKSKQWLLLIMSSEDVYFEQLVTLRHTYSSPEGLRASSTYFKNDGPNKKGMLVENIYFGIFIRKAQSSVPSLNRFYSDLSQILGIVKDNVFPNSTVAFVAEDSMAIQRVHFDKFTFKVKYIGSQRTLDIFKRTLTREKGQDAPNSVAESVDITRNVEEIQDYPQNVEDFPISSTNDNNSRVSSPKIRQNVESEVIDDPSDQCKSLTKGIRDSSVHKKLQFDRISHEAEETDEYESSTSPFKVFGGRKGGHDDSGIEEFSPVK